MEDEAHEVAFVMRRCTMPTQVCEASALYTYAVTRFAPLSCSLVHVINVVCVGATETVLRAVNVAELETLTSHP